MDSLSLRKSANLASRENATRFKRALTLLQRDFRILPIGIAEAGAWHYAFIYDTVHHHFPDLIEAAHSVSESSARQNILESYFLSVGSALKSEIKSFFKWTDQQLEKALINLVESGFLQNNIVIENKQGKAFTIKKLIDK